MATCCWRGPDDDGDDDDDDDDDGFDANMDWRHGAKHDAAMGNRKSKANDFMLVNR